jgi:hypothetical protein
MNKDVAMKWVQALRSGKYQQGKARLRDGLGQYCCLGVLAEIQGFFDKGLCDPAAPALSSKARDLVGLSYGLGDLGHFADKPERIAWPDSIQNTAARTQPSLAHLNDYGGCSFEQIADFIELNYEVL